jgi:GNAT superfamily N-acetyltransferase
MVGGSFGRALLRIVDYDDIPDTYEPQLQLLDASTGWSPMDSGRLEQARKTGYPAAPYFGVYAVEGSEVQSAVRVLRLPYTTGDGKREVVSAIQGVVTRRERSRMGLAKRLLEEVHRREAEAGIRFAMLWTGHSIMAHNLYTSIGYEDVYTPKLAIRKCGRSSVERRGYELRAFRMKDAETIGRLHDEATRGRVGFTPRPKGILQSLFKLGFVKTDMFRLVLHEGKPVGYLQARRDRDWVRSDEIVLKRGVDPDTVVSLLEAERPGGWLTLLGTFVTDNTGLLRRRGYLLTDGLYSGLLARPLQVSDGSLKELGTDSKAFTCHYLDYF